MKVMDNTLYTKLVSVAIAINAVQVWIQLVLVFCSKWHIWGFLINILCNVVLSNLFK